MTDDLPELMGLRTLHRFLADRGVAIGYSTIHYHCREGRIGHHVEDRWYVTKSEAEAYAESLLAEQREEDS